MHDERHEDTHSQALPVEYEKVRNASYELQNGLDDIQHVVHTTYVDTFSLPTLSRSQAAVSPRRRWNTAAAACIATATASL